MDYLFNHNTQGKSIFLPLSDQNEIYFLQEYLELDSSKKEMVQKFYRHFVKETNTMRE